MHDEVFTIEEVAALPDLAKTVYAMAHGGEIPAFTFRGRWRIERTDLDQWIHPRPRGGGGARDGQ